MGANEDLLIAYCQNCSSTNDAINLIETQLVDVNINNSEPIRTAVIADCSAMVQYLINVGSEFKMLNEICLRTAIQNLSYDISKILLNAGSDPNVSFSENTNDSAYCISYDVSDNNKTRDLLAPYNLTPLY